MVPHGLRNLQWHRWRLYWPRPLRCVGTHRERGPQPLGGSSWPPGESFSYVEMQEMVIWRFLKTGSPIAGCFTMEHHEHPIYTWMI